MPSSWGAAFQGGGCHRRQHRLPRGVGECGQARAHGNYSIMTGDPDVRALKSKGLMNQGSVVGACTIRSNSPSGSHSHAAQSH